MSSNKFQLSNLQTFIAQSSIQNISEFFFHLMNFKNDSSFLLNLEKYKNFNLKEVGKYIYSLVDRRIKYFYKRTQQS